MTEAAVKERPILFSPHGVRAIFEGRKTQERRLVKPQPIDRDGDGCRWSWPVLPNQHGWKFTAQGPNASAEVAALLARHARCPYGEPGERLLVCCTSTLTLEVTNVRVERLQDVTEEVALAEGTESEPGVSGVRVWRDYSVSNPHVSGWFEDPRESYRTLWDSLYDEPEGWASNPWVWVLEFRRVAP